MVCGDRRSVQPSTNDLNNRVFLRVAMTKKAGCSEFTERGIEQRTSRYADQHDKNEFVGGLNKRGLVLRVGEARGF